MPNITQPYLDNCSSRVREFDARRRQASSVDGRAMPSLDALAIGESRGFQLCVMFADLRHSTQIASALNLEQMSRVLVHFLTESTRIIRDFGGQVEKYSGDRILGLFGTEEGTAEEITKGAVNCALTIRCVAKKVLNPFYNSISLPSVKVGVGIDWGNVVIEKIGIRGDNELSVIGETVNIASKLEDLAKEDEILLGYDVYQRLPIDYQKMCSQQQSSQTWTYHYPQTGQKYAYYSFTGDWNICR